ncbi:MAG: right-handed parallel beta-helix repeat-containing protein [Kiritimatiellaeota bacterium]|nr:right-handed parallel beta-helix repeat-containing protein [Kiritimatiellota bacterium]
MKTQYLQRMLIGLGLTMALAVPWASAMNYYVVTSSQQPSPTPPWTNWGWAHTNLIEVVAAARADDTVYVTNNATYWLTNQITVSYAITVRSWGPGGILDPTNTILNGNYPNTTNRHFTLNKYGATVAGFTLTKGCDNWARGGSILLQNGIVTNCTIVSNYAFAAYPYGGGGVHMQDSSGGVWNCTINGNIASNAGGGIGINSGGPWRIANCLISGNSAIVQGCGIWASSPTAGTVISNCWVVSNYVGGNGGAGIYLKGECHNSFIMGNTCDPANWGEGGGIRMQNGSLIRNCLIANNIAKYAGGIATYDVTSIQNCTIVSNYASDGWGGIYVARTNVAAKIENTIIWGNSASGSGATYSNWIISANVGAVSTFSNCCTSPNIYNAYGNLTDVNTITNDPRLVSVTDFRLQSSSPCINAGVNRAWMEGGWDVYGNRRIDNFRRTVDVGAYEYLSKGTVFGFQ